MSLRTLILTSSYPPTMGGAETYAHTLAHGLARDGFDVVVVTDAVAGAPRDERTDGVTVARRDGYRALLADPGKLPWEQLCFGLLPDLEDVLRDWRPHVVVANSLECTVLGRIVADDLGVPLVGAYHEHDPRLEPFGAGRLSLGYRVLAPDLVLAGSTSYAARALEHLPAERVALVLHGVDTDVFDDRPELRDQASAVRRRYGVQDHELLVVTSGRLKERKGHLELIRAFASLRRTDAVLAVVGGVSSSSLEYADTLAETVAACTDARVVVDTTASLADMPAVLAASDVVAQPSRSEGLGLALLEAMSMARPVVATRIDGFDEVLGPDGPAVRVPVGDVDAIADALTTLLDDADLRRTLGAQAREHVLAGFSRRRMIASTAALLEQVAATEAVR